MIQQELSNGNHMNHSNNNTKIGMMEVNDNIIKFVNNNDDIDNNNDDDDDEDDDDDDIHIEEHHELVIQQSMSIGTDDDDDDNDNYHNNNTTMDYYSSDDGSRSRMTGNNNSNNNGSFLYHSTKFWNTESNYDNHHHHQPQHLYNYLESTEGFLLNGSHDRNTNHILLNNLRNHSSRNNRKNNTSNTMSGWKCCIGTMIVFIVISIIAILVPNRIARSTPGNDASSSFSNGNKNNNNNNTIYILPTIHKFKGAPQYTCPNNNNNNFEDVIEDEIFNVRFGNKIDINMIQQDMTEFINTFRDRNITEYMDVGSSIDHQNTITYNTLKEQMLTWRTSKYIPSLKKTGANIFELNCGVGLNLFMTYEMIQQSQSKDDIRDVHLYGTTTTTTTTSNRNSNDDDNAIRSAITANLLLDTILQKEANFVGGGKRGMICPTIAKTTTSINDHYSNSKNNQYIDLSFIPDNSFDLVYTSYVPLIRDIWDTDTSIITNEEFIQRHVDICHTKDTDWKSMTLYNISQQQQELIYGQYVSEMIRITKPGNIIAIEHVPIPFCDAIGSSTTMNYNVGDVRYYSGAGIPQSFWYNNQTYERYQWNDIDLTSIEIEVDTSSSSALQWLTDNNNNNNNNHTHYHVVIRKIKK